jgi:hypothetical protein
MNEEQHEALLSELRALRREVRGVRLASRIIAALLSLGTLAVIIRYEWFRGPYQVLALIAIAGAIIWLPVIVLRDTPKELDRKKEKGDADMAVTPQP